MRIQISCTPKCMEPQSSNFTNLPTLASSNFANLPTLPSSNFANQTNLESETTQHHNDLVLNSFLTQNKAKIGVDQFRTPKILRRSLELQRKVVVNHENETEQQKNMKRMVDTPKVSREEFGTPKERKVMVSREMRRNNKKHERKGRHTKKLLAIPSSTVRGWIP